MSDTPTKKAASKRVAKKASPSELDAQRARREEVQARVQREYDEKVDAATADLEALEETVTQREWLLITLRLDRTRQQIAEDGSLRLLALAWVKDKRDHGGASWDTLLEMTDRDLVEAHGFPTEEPDETVRRLTEEPPQDEPAGEQD